MLVDSTAFVNQVIANKTLIVISFKLFCIFLFIKKCKYTAISFKISNVVENMDSNCETFKQYYIETLQLFTKLYTKKSIAIIEHHNSAENYHKTFYSSQCPHNNNFATIKKKTFFLLLQFSLLLVYHTSRYSDSS